MSPSQRHTPPIPQAPLVPLLSHHVWHQWPIGLLFQAQGRTFYSHCSPIKQVKHQNHHGQRGYYSEHGFFKRCKHLYFLLYLMESLYQRWSDCQAPVMKIQHHHRHVGTGQHRPLLKTKVLYLWM